MQVINMRGNWVKYIKYIKKLSVRNFSLSLKVLQNKSLKNKW